MFLRTSFGYTKKPKNIAEKSLTNGIFQQLNDGKFLEEIHVKLQLTTLKPLHTQRLTELYDHIATNEGKADGMLLGSEKPLLRNQKPMLALFEEECNITKFL